MSATKQSFDEAAQGVVAMARFAGARGWVPATSGNFSVRIDAARAALTATGGDKAALDASGVIEVEIAGPPHPRASAEGPLHLVRYAAAPGIGAIAHVHGVAATVLSRRHARAGALRLEGWELLKAFAGVTTHDVALDIPIVANDQDTRGWRRWSRRAARQRGAGLPYRRARPICVGCDGDGNDPSHGSFRFSAHRPDA